MGSNKLPYMTSVEPGSLFQLISTGRLPPAMAPSPVLTEEDVSEPPLPAIANRAPPSPGGSAATPTPPKSNAHQGKVVGFLSSLLSMFLVSFLLF
ncbi:hypothetical protein BVC80_1287g15 [Macleaya cordata]|uniref:Uncharacterized protein n=1 Tax=Macleaya cordata TaxID=56857 RepID=A0A200Q821_MACCD|nr:hypothetical protein BVC80_1287g15 [Macleaya cordata]